MTRETVAVETPANRAISLMFFAFSNPSALLWEHQTRLVRKATLSKLEAAISVQGAPMTQPRYHTTAPKSGVKTEVLKGSGLQELVNQAGNKAFLQTGNNGNRLVLQRTGKGRTPLHSAHGPSVSKMLEKVYQGGKITDEGLREDILKIYQDNLRKQIERMVTA